MLPMLPPAMRAASLQRLGGLSLCWKEGLIILRGTFLLCSFFISLSHFCVAHHPVKVFNDCAMYQLSTRLFFSSCWKESLVYREAHFIKRSSFVHFCVLLTMPWKFFMTWACINLAQSQCDQRRPFLGKESHWRILKKRVGDVYSKHGHRGCCSCCYGLIPATICVVVDSFHIMWNCDIV